MNLPTPEPRPELDRISAYEPGKPLDEIARNYDFDGEPVKLTSNENPYSPPERFRSVYEDQFEQLNRYPDGGMYHLRQALSQTYDWPIDGIVIGAGSDELTDFLARATLRPDDEVVVADPSFVRHFMLPKIMGATPVPVPVKDDYTFDLEGMLEAVTDRTRWICFPNPNNPTSQYVSGSELRGFLNRLPEDVTVILDEAYCEFMSQSDYPDGRTILEDFSGAEDPTIILQRTFSKAYALAGLRVGYGLMNTELAHELHKVRPPFNVSRPAQAVAREALDDEQFLSETRRRIRKERDRVIEELKARGVDLVEPSVNFFLMKVPGIPDAGRLCERLMQQGVIVRSMAPYGLEEQVRVTIGKPGENDRLLAALDDIIDR